MNSYSSTIENEKEKMKNNNKKPTKIFIHALNKNKRNISKNINNYNYDDINKNSINQSSFSKYTIYSSNRKNLMNNYTYNSNDNLPYINNNYNNKTNSFIIKNSLNYSQNLNKTEYNSNNNKNFLEKEFIFKNKFKIIISNKNNKNLLKFNFIEKPKLLTLTLKKFVEKQKKNINIKKYNEILDKLLPLNLNVDYKNKLFARNDKKRISFVAPFNKKLFANYLTEKFNYTDELNDKCDVLLNEKHELYSFLRSILMTDFNNTNTKNNKKLFSNIENLFNYKYDIFIYPQFKNNFLFRHYNYIDDKITVKRLCDYNCLSKEICHSLNKTRMNNFLGINDDIYKLYYRDILNENEKIDTNNEKYTDKFNLEDFFEKKYQKNNFIKFANQKEKDSIKNFK